MISTVTIGRVVTATVWLGVGSLVQALLWREPEDATVVPALTKHAYLWLVFALVALLAGEQVIRALKKRLPRVKAD